jgi:hypothetical protein
MDLFFKIPLHFLLLNSISAMHLPEQPVGSLYHGVSVLATSMLVHPQTYSILTILRSLAFLVSHN